MIRHCDGECGKHDCYVGFLEARLTEVERERDQLQAELRTVAERQREADIDHCYAWLGHANVGVPLDQFMRETPLVTEAQIFVEQTGKK